MYIISKFHDYYDCLMKQGLDKSLIYHRDEEYISSIPRNIGVYDYYQDFLKRTVNGYFYLPSLSPSCYANTYLNINTGLLGFCGKQYIVMMCQYKDITLASCIYSRWFDKLKQSKIEGYQKNIYHFMEKYLAEKHKKYFYNSYQCELAITEKNMLTVLNNQQGIKLRDELFIELDCPVFFMYQSYSGNTVLIKNPVLKPFDFQCMLSPEIAFQEIALYIGNFLTKKDNPLQITDNKVLCAAKGFDIKTSFRKPSSKA